MINFNFQLSIFLTQTIYQKYKKSICLLMAKFKVFLKLTLIDRLYKLVLQNIQMASTQIQRDSEEKHYELTVQACPSDLLKTVDNLKKMAMTKAFVELSFKTVHETQIFTRVLNRQEEEQKVANELKMTFFHNVRGKIRKMELVRNQSFMAMKKVRFNSAYHVTLFLKYYSDRLKQIQNEYKYHIVSGKDGFLHVYINDENISFMFVNEIRDMKKMLQFLEIKDYLLCERFIYSEALCNQLRKMHIFHQIWYKGKQSTIIFYSEKQTLTRMKGLVQLISKSHISILKMADNRFSFLVNYLLFKQINDSLISDLKKLQTVDVDQVEFNQNKLSLVVHDMHQIFASEIIYEIMQKMKYLVLISVKGKGSRGFYNILKKDYSSKEYLKFSYSKKNICMCINKSKLDSIADIRKLFYLLGDNIDHDSQITFSWFHLQQKILCKYRQDLIQRYSTILSTSKFHVQNFEKFIQNRDLKCILRLKNVNQETSKVSDYISQILTDLIKAWDQIQNNPTKEQKKPQKCRIVDQQPQRNDVDDIQSSSQDASQYGNQQQNYLNLQKQPVQIQHKVEGPQENKFSEFQEVGNRKFHQKVIELINKNSGIFSNFSIDEFGLWKQERSLKSLSNYLLEEVELATRIKSIISNQTVTDSISLASDSIQNMRFYHFSQFPKSLRNTDQLIVNHKASIFDLETEQKYVVCLKKGIKLYPVCSIQVLKSIQI